MQDEERRRRREARLAKAEEVARRNEEAGDTRLHAGGALFEAPGARHGTANKRPTPKAKPWRAKTEPALRTGSGGEKDTGRSLRAERKETDQRAAEAAAARETEPLAGGLLKLVLDQRRRDGTARPVEGKGMVAGGRELVERIDRKTGELVEWQWRWRDDLTSFEDFQ